MSEYQACENTDKEIWREEPGNFYSDSIHVTKSGGIGLDCGGHVFVKSIRAWHGLAAELERVTKERERYKQALSRFDNQTPEVKCVRCEDRREKWGDICGCAIIDELRVRLSAANRAIREMMNELGVPQPGYPAPIANAYRIGEKALAPEPAGPIDAHAKYTWQPGD